MQPCWLIVTRSTLETNTQFSFKTLKQNICRSRSESVYKLVISKNLCNFLTYTPDKNFVNKSLGSVVVPIWNGLLLGHTIVLDWPAAVSTVSDLPLTLQCVCYVTLSCSRIEWYTLADPTHSSHYMLPCVYATGSGRSHTLHTGKWKNVESLLILEKENSEMLPSTLDRTNPHPHPQVSE